jgi:hypothetical protein
MDVEAKMGLTNALASTLEAKNFLVMTADRLRELSLTTHNFSLAELPNSDPISSRYVEAIRKLKNVAECLDVHHAEVMAISEFLERGDQAQENNTGS